jgi:hypothetical protein
LKRAFYLMLARVSGGDEAEMLRMVREDVRLTAQTKEEIAGLEEGRAIQPLPFTSINMCGACAVDVKSEARRVAARYEALAHGVDRGLAAEIAQIASGSV